MYDIGSLAMRDIGTEITPQRRLRISFTAGASSQEAGTTARSVSQKSEQLSAPLPSFIAIYFQHFTDINARLMYAEVGKCMRVPEAYLKNQLCNGAAAPAIILNETVKWRATQVGIIEGAGARAQVPEFSVTPTFAKDRGSLTAT